MECGMRHRFAIVLVSMALSGCVDVSLQDKSRNACFEVHIPKDETIRAIKSDKCTGQTWVLIKVGFTGEGTSQKWTYRWYPIVDELREAELAL